jgi:DNA-binding transcriptional MocR family regulator
MLKYSQQEMKEMFEDLTFNKEMPIYAQIFHYIKEMIESGMLPKDSKLPSTRELASVLHVSRNSIVKVYEYLEDEGLVYKVSDKGTFVATVKISKENNWNINWSKRINDYTLKANELDIVKKELIYKKGMISFKSIAPDESLFDLDEVKRSFLNRMSLEGEKLLNYGYAQGYKPLIDYLMHYMTTKGINTTGKKILITNGFTEGFDILLSSLVQAGDNILCENPTHNTAIKLMKLHNLNIVGIKMQEDGICIDELKKAVKDNIKLAYLIPSYHNPTGIVMPYEKRIEVFNIFKEAGVPIIEDGFNEELQHLSSHIAPIAAFSGRGNGIIYVGSLSKILFPGLRIGWILGDENLIDMLESVKRSRNIHTSFLDQALLYEYLANGGFERYMKKARKFYKNKFENALKLVKQYVPHEFVTGNGGLHIFVKLRNIDTRQLLEKCYEDGVVFLPGDIFYVDGKGGNTLRLGFSRINTKEMERGLQIIGKNIKELEK